MRVLILVGMATVLISAGAYASGGSGAGEIAAAAPGQKELKGKKKKRPGCGKFCNQAGGFGCEGEACDPEIPPVGIPEQTLDVSRNRIVAITATCNLETDCVGAIILDNIRRGEYGRANLKIPALTTKKVKVGISRKAFETLKEKGRDTKAFAVGVLNQEPFPPLSISDKLTILPPR